MESIIVQEWVDIDVEMRHFVVLPTSETDFKVNGFSQNILQALTKAKQCLMQENPGTSFLSPVSVIVIPGGGVRGRYPAEWTLERIREGVKVYNSNKNMRWILLSLGTPHKPNEVFEGKTVTEAGAAADFLVSELGVDPAHIYEEAASLDTIGNAYFCRRVHVDML